VKTHRFIGPYDLQKTEIVLDDAASRQMASVLKLRTGESVVLCDGKGREAPYEILEIDRNEIGFARIGDAHRVESEPENAVTLYAAILKRENFEWAVQKAVECGVTRIVPVVSRRTIKKDVKQERLQEIAKEAGELSGRGIVPQVSGPMKFEDAVADAKSNHVNFFFDVSSDEPELRCRGSVGLFVGPEGGWDEEEIGNAKRAGFTIASLGPRVLRGETACAVAVYLATI
jgi:16S rRNA (uracil1498-N3)-methyltransferase